MFASKSVLEHVLRGFVGVLSLVAAVLLGATHFWIAILAVLVALVAFRGCPMCWTVGLIETILPKILRQRLPDGSVRCVDGQCGAKPA